jgi:hypothetical protein
MVCGRSWERRSGEERSIDRRVETGDPAAHAVRLAVSCGGTSRRSSAAEGNGQVFLVADFRILGDVMVRVCSGCREEHAGAKGQMVPIKQLAPFAAPKGLEVHRRPPAPLEEMWGEPRD